MIYYLKEINGSSRTVIDCKSTESRVLSSMGRTQQYSVFSSINFKAYIGCATTRGSEDVTVPFVSIVLYRVVSLLVYAKANASKDHAYASTDSTIRLIDRSFNDMVYKE